MSPQQLLYVFDKAPYSNASGQEALDAALIGAAFEQQVSLLFVHDGVFQLKAGQDTSKGLLKQYTKSYGALPDHGIEQLYVHDNSLQARGLLPEDLGVAIEVLDSTQIAELIRQQNRVFTF